jgi:hypothetical protein
VPGQMIVRLPHALEPAKPAPPQQG